MTIAVQLAESMAKGRVSHGRQVLPLLTPRIYADLRRLARSVMRGERTSHTLQPTAVLNEAFSRLIRAQISTQDAEHFFRLAAQAMRHVLIDYARQRNRDKRVTPVDCGCLESDSAAQFDVLDIDRALNALSQRAPRAAQFIELRYFAGLEDAEISAICDVSITTVERDCRFARAFLAGFSKNCKIADAATEAEKRNCVLTRLAG